MERQLATEFFGELAQSIHSSLDLATVLRRVAKGAEDLCHGDLAEIALWDMSAQAMVLRHWALPSPPRHGNLRIEPGKGAGGLVMATGQPFRTDDYANDPRISEEYLASALEAGIASVLVVPIHLAGVVDGLLYLGRRARRPFTDADEALLQRLADNAGIAIANARLYAEADRRRREAQELLAARVSAERQIQARVQQERAIAELRQLALSGLGVDALMEQTTCLVAQTLDVDLCQMLELSPDGQRLLLRHGVGWNPGCVGCTTIPADTTSLAGSALWSDGPVIVNELGDEERFRGSPHLREHGVVSGVTVAIRGRDRPIGVLGVHSRRKRTFTRDDSSFLHAVVSTLTTAIERKAMETALRESEARFRAAFEQSGIGRALQAFDGSYLRVNAALCRIVGYSEQELLEMTWQSITHPDDVSTGLDRRAELESGARDSFSIEKRYRHKEGHSVWVSMTASMVRDAAGQPLYFLSEIEDITPRKRAEDALREHADRLQILHEVDQGVIMAESPEAIARAAVRRIRRLVPCARVEVFLFDLETNEAVLLAVDAADSQGASAGTRSPMEGFDLGSMQAMTIRGGDDAVGSCLSVPLLFGGHPIGTLNLSAEGAERFQTEHAQIAQEVADSLAIAIQGSGLFAQVRASRESLRDLSHRLVEVQEIERRHIARELHDEIGQVLTGLKLTLEASARRLSGPRAVSLDKARRHVNDLITRVRELSLDLRPAMLDDLGLLSALLWHFERYTGLTGVRVHVEHSGIDHRFDPKVETGAYRIAQEALTNVARHARVRDVTVRVWADEHVLRLALTDRGVGFDQAATTLRMSSGLTGMRERAALLGGRLTIESSPGAGTRVLAHLPLA